MITINYRKAEFSDALILTEKRIQFATEISGPQHPDAVEQLRTTMIASFEKLMRDETVISFIAESNGQVAGIGSVHLREMPGNFSNPSGRWGYIMNMYTLPEFRRKGICTRILHLLMEEAVKKGVTAFELHATQDGEFVYRQNGFKMFQPCYRKYLQ